MTNKKLTDAEIKSALKGAILNAKGYDSKVWSIEVYKLENAFNLINRLQADVENYKQIAENQQKIILDKAFENKRLKKVSDIRIECLGRSRAKAKAEAYKEFAEGLKEKATQKFDWNEYVEVEEIDNLLKELVGEE